jgi:hypothetical protein
MIEQRRRLRAVRERAVCRLIIGYTFERRRIAGADHIARRQR